jgi:hypothetical protein
VLVSSVRASDRHRVSARTVGGAHRARSARPGSDPLEQRATGMCTGHQVSMNRSTPASSAGVPVTTRASPGPAAPDGGWSHAAQPSRWPLNDTCRCPLGVRASRGRRARVRPGTGRGGGGWRQFSGLARRTSALASSSRPSRPARPRGDADRVCVPRTVTRPLTRRSEPAFRPRRHRRPQPAQHDLRLWPSDSRTCCSPAC